MAFKDHPAKKGARNAVLEFTLRNCSAIKGKRPVAGITNGCIYSWHSFEGPILAACPDGSEIFAYDDDPKSIEKNRAAALGKVTMFGDNIYDNPIEWDWAWVDAFNTYSDETLANLRYFLKTAYPTGKKVLAFTLIHNRSKRPIERAHDDMWRVLNRNGFKILDSARYEHAGRGITSRMSVFMFSFR